MSATPRDTTIRLLPTDNVAERQRRLLARIDIVGQRLFAGAGRVPEDALARLSA